MVRKATKDEALQDSIAIHMTLTLAFAGGTGASTLLIQTVFVFPCDKARAMFCTLVLVILVPDRSPVLPTMRSLLISGMKLKSSFLPIHCFECEALCV